MPYLLLILGFVIGGFALYRFFLKANRKQILMLIMSLSVLVLSVAIFMLAITGRLPAAIGILAALFPLVLTWWQAQRKARTPDGKMSRYDALEILGLKGEPTEEDINEAHKRLMKKVHPDQEGSEGLAKNLNEAKDTLLKK